MQLKVSDVTITVQYKNPPHFVDSVIWLGMFYLGYMCLML